VLQTKGYGAFVEERPGGHVLKMEAQGDLAALKRDVRDCAPIAEELPE